MPRKRKFKSPFGDFSIEEVAAAEASTYVIQVGSDLYCHDGAFAFNRRGAIIHYNKIRNELAYIAKNGDAREKKHARRCLENLKVLPLRIH